MTQRKLAPFQRFSNRHGQLLVAAILVGVMWGWVLPWVANRPTVKHRIEFLDAQGIDPSAMFYTELEMMDGVLDRIENPSQPVQGIRTQQ